MAAPEGLAAGGLALWSAVSYEGMPERDVALLVEACRARDRLDKLDQLLRGDVGVWARLVHALRTEDYELRIDDALVKANATAGQLRALLGALPVKKAASKGTALDELAKRRAGAQPPAGRSRAPASQERRT